MIGTWALANWRKIALGLGVVALLASYGAVARYVHNAATAACEARIQAAQIEALRQASEATQQQRARADALATANDTLQGKVDEILAQDRDACLIDADTRGRVMSIRPDYPDPARPAP